MDSSRQNCRFALTAVLAFCICVQQGNAQTTLWVDAAEGDDSFAGSSAEPFATISRAAEVANGAGGNYIIKVREGDYTQAHELAGGATTPGYPIIIDESDIRIEGDDTNPANYPRLGGDVAAEAASSSIDAIIRIAVPSDGNLEDIHLSRLRFVGENTANLDAPSAIRVVCDSEYSLLRSGASYIVIERSEMKATNVNGRPMVLVEASDSAATAGAVQFTLLNSTIWCSDRGGAEVRVTANGSEESAFPRLTLQDTTILAQGDDDALFGVALTNEADADGRPALRLFRVQIDSSASNTGHGIATGVLFSLTPSDAKTVQVLTGTSEVIGCNIGYCTGDGIQFFATEDGDGNANCFIDDDTFQFNRIHHNDGAGIRINWALDTGYLSIHSQNNLIYRNGIGLWLDGVHEDIGGNNCDFLNETIVNNAGFGIRLDGDEVPPSPGIPGPSLVNCIVWGNNSGNAQMGGDLSLDLQANGLLVYSCWQGLSSPSSGNTNVNPQFADSGNDDYHLTASSSSVIDTGNNFPVDGLPSQDIDGEDRTVNGDGANGDEVDMGADEYDP